MRRFSTILLYVTIAQFLCRKAGEDSLYPI